MQLDRKLCIFFHGLDQLGSLIRHQQTCHILDTDGICTHLLNFFGSACPIFQRIGITQRIGQCNLSMASAFLLFHSVGGVYGLLQVAQIIQTVKNTDNIDTVCNGLLHKGIYNVICVRSVAQNILTAEQHLQLGLFEAVTQLAESVPGILLQEAKGCVKGGTAPALHGMVSYLIHLLHNGKHKIRWHSCGNQRLVGVTQYGFRNFDRFLCLF